MSESLTFKQRVLAFWEKVNKNGPVPPLHPEMSNCWIWEGCKTYDGYGTFSLGGSREKQNNVLAHQVAYFLNGGVWPTLTIDHLCHVTSCVRSDHLRHVTLYENHQNRAVQECKEGHPLADPNLYHYKSRGMPKRRCLTCWKVKSAEYRAKIRAKRKEA